jgi:hypothetical protein
MIIRKIINGNDWSFGKGLSDYAVAEQAIEENMKTKILEWVGDCFWNLSAGVNWLARLDVGQQANLLEDIKSVVLNCFGVVGITAMTIQLDPPSRHALIQGNVSTIYSPSFQFQVEQSAGSFGD